jgi:ComF family protein
MTILHALRHACGLDERRCAACTMPYSAPGHTSGGLPLCPDCLAAVRWARPLCARCGLPLTPSGGGGVCAPCLAAPPPWDRLYAVGPYEGVLRDVLLRAKYRADRSACRLLGLLVAEKLGARPGEPSELGEQIGPIWSDGFGPDLILPMPLHPARLRRRGFNQCQEIAEPVSRLLGIPRRPDLARRLVAAHPQTGLRRVERLRNLEHAFAADPGVRGRRLLILDDTVTTGTTVRRLARCLLHAGAAGITVAVIAVTLPHKGNTPA